MCGILAVLQFDKLHADALRAQALLMVRKLRHRGPDWSGVYSDENVILCHERLSIVDVTSGAQPLLDVENGNVLAVNGEIYNHKALRHKLKDTHPFQTESDCEVILYLYKEFGKDFVNMLSGIFAFVLYDKKKNSVFVARDPIGVIPLYVGSDKSGNIFFASELKALSEHCTKVEDFPPGCYLDSSVSLNPVRYYNPSWFNEQNIPNQDFREEKLAGALEAAVRQQLMCDVPYGVLISGGLDSSIIAALCAKYTKNRIESAEEGKTESAWWPVLHSFSVGLKDSPDLKAARLVASHLQTKHHEIHFTVQEGIDALSDVIYHLETFDVTTIRASTPMYLMARKIRAMGIKMILSGEGADEVFGGYLYFHKAPNAAEFYGELIRKISQLHKYDCLRANKAMSAWGVEARVPFLDLDFLEVAMNINPVHKMCGNGKMEKTILRRTFEDLLPKEVVWRQKEQFSDGVGYGWIDSLKNFAAKEISDGLMEKAKFRYPEKTPQTKEAYLYRTLFERHFPSSAAIDLIPWGPSVACSSPAALRWDPALSAVVDPSGRAVLGVHEKAVSLNNEK